MLILRRQDGQWIRATHQSGDVLWIKFYDIVPGCECCGRDGQLQVGFDDAAHNFQIDRPDRVSPPAAHAEEYDPRPALERRIPRNRG